MIKMIAAYISAMHPLEIMLRAAFVGVGTLLVGVAIWMAVNNLIIINTYDHARAEISRCDLIGPVASKGLNNFSVEVQFERNGKMRRSNLERSNTKYEIGEVIDVYFRPETSYKVIAGDFEQMWFFVLVVAVPGALMLFFGLRPARRGKEAKAS